MAADGVAMSEASRSTRSYWVFQFRPGEQNREVESGPIGTQVDWRLTAYKEAVGLDDIVFFWRASGPRSALIGWGSVTVTAFEPADEEVTRIEVTTRARFDEPILKKDVDAHPILATVGVFSGRQGTNFRLSVEQAAALIELIHRRGLRAPEDVNPETLAGSARARIQRGLAELGKIAEGVPDAALQAELMSLVQRASTEGATLGLKETANKLIALQRAGTWVSNVNVQSIAQQLTEDWSRLALTSPQPKMFGPGASVLAPTVDAPASSSAPSLEVQAPSPTPAPAINVTVPTDHWYCAWEREDLIGIKPSVSNLARYMAHQELLPPRAVGIFGDWGSGKSFFLRALRSEIALYAHQSREARTQQRRTVFCGNVVQIEFNAWHYVESNLWASIAGHVFEQLYTELQRSTQARTDDIEINALYKSLDLYKEAVTERERLEADAETLKSARDAAEASVKRTRLERDELVSGACAAAKKAAQLAFEALPEAQKKTLATVAESARIGTAKEAITQAGYVIEEGRSTFGRIRLALQAWGPLGFLCASIAVLAILFGVPALISWVIKHWLPSVEPLIAAVGSYLVLGGTVLTWLRGQAAAPLKIAARVLDILSEAEEAARNKHRAALEALDAQVIRLEQQIATTNAQIDEHKRLIAQAREAIDPRNLGTKLKEFLEERARSKAYEAHLGLITLVRRDFGTLSTLMRKYLSQRDAALPGAVIEADDLIGPPQPVPFIERIVLYIDDLDRCPPPKVVEVLQAVHLMLGFPLFVVVLAVDVRWIRESLLKHYPDLLSNAGSPTALDPPVTSVNLHAQADDYLEKIFHIPFRIPSLSGDGARNLITGLLKEPFLNATPADRAVASVPILDLMPKELKLYPAEELAIQQLSRSIGISPRRIRRFLDQYMIMRAGMEDGIIEYITRTSNQFQSILGLFAMLSGAANSAPWVLQRLHKQLRESTAGAPIAMGLSQWMTQNLGAMNPDDYERSALSQAAQYMDQAEPDRAKLSAALVQWIPEVARYSFREVRL